MWQRVWRLFQRLGGCDPIAPCQTAYQPGAQSSTTYGPLTRRLRGPRLGPALPGWTRPDKPGTSWACLRTRGSASRMTWTRRCRATSLRAGSTGLG
eukprot:6765458-Lingulodinium_polyedra.AAC.1